MSKWSYELEEERLRRLYDEVPSDVADDSDSSLEDDHLEVQNDNTDSEQDMSDNNVAPDFTVRRKTREPCFIGRDGTRWKKHFYQRKNVRTRTDNLVTQLPGVKGEARQMKTAMEIWSLFFTNEMLEKIVFYTNQHIELKQYSESNRTARLTDIDELKALFGLLYIAGKNRQNHQNASDLFRTNGMSTEIFRLTMSMERFKLLLQNLRFDDTTSRPERQCVDKLAAIREIFDEFNANLPKYFSISQYATVDEMLWAFRGRCGFRIYIPSKPNRYGLKIYSLADAKMFYTTKMEIYVGKQPTGPYEQDTSNISLVPRLCQPIWGTKRNVTIDNFFTSTVLADKLLNDHRLTIIGTLRKNKPQIPVEMKMTRPEKSIMFGFQEKATLVSYIPRKNKNVFVLSTMHRDDGIDMETGKPDIICDYNKTKGGVDTVDKLSAAYNCARITRRWPMVIFYGLLNIAGINSFVIFDNNNPAEKRVQRRTFLEDLGYQLVEAHIRKRTKITGLPRTIKLRIQEIYNITEVEEGPSRANTNGRCSVCSSKKSRKTRFRCHRCKTFLCLEHVTPFCEKCTQCVDELTK